MHYCIKFQPVFVAIMVHFSVQHICKDSQITNTKGFKKESHCIEVVNEVFRTQSQYCRSNRRIYKVTGICCTDSRFGT